MTVFPDPAEEDGAFGETVADVPGVRLAFTPIDDTLARLRVEREGAAPITATARGLWTDVGLRDRPAFRLDEVHPAAYHDGDDETTRVVLLENGALCPSLPDLPLELLDPLVDWARGRQAAYRSASLALLPSGEYRLVRARRPRPVGVADFWWGPFGAYFARCPGTSDDRPRADQPLIGCAIMEPAARVQTLFVPCLAPERADGDELLLVVPLSGELLVQRPAYTVSTTRGWPYPGDTFECVPTGWLTPEDLTKFRVGYPRALADRLAEGWPPAS